MKIGIVCKRCNKDILEISIKFNNISFRKDLTVVNSHNSNPLLVQFDQEWFSGNVECIIYNCDCGEVVVKNQNSLLDDFVKIIGSTTINYEDLLKKEYENLKIIILDDSLAGTVVKL